MTKAPSKTLLKKLEQWHEVRAKAAEFANKEKELRLEIFGLAFPKPEEGSKYNKLELGDGYVLQGDYKINRTIDVAALDEVKKKMDPVAFNRAFRYVPDLIKSGFKDLSDDQKQIASIAIVAKPGTPALEIVLPKKK